LLAAIAVHVALLAVLAAMPLRFMPPSTKAIPIAVQFTFAGMADSGGNPNAGGKMPVATAPAPASSQPATAPATIPTAPAPSLTVVAAPALEAEDVMESTPSMLDELPNDARDLGPIIGPVTQSGSGLGHGTGTGVGDGSGDGVAGDGGSGRGGFGGAHPDYLRIPQPRYPAIARQNGWQGKTILRVEIRTDGRVGAVEVLRSSGYAVLDDAAVEAVRAGEFMPARVAGKPVSASVEVPIRFQLLERQS
jgi:protein TonB